MNQSIVVSVLNQVEKNPDKPAIIVGNEVVSYRQLWGKSAAAARKLKSLDVRSGNRVVLSASVSPSFVYGYLGTHLLHAVAVPVDPQSSESRLTNIIEQVRPHAVFLTKPFNLDSTIPIFSIKTFEDLNSTADSFSFPLPDAVADILFTTGTTGDPKGVVLTHETISRTARNINTFVRNTAEDREVVPLPLSHSFGLGRLRCNLSAGGAVILVNGFTLMGNIFRAFEEWGATGLSAVPAGIALLFRISKDRIGDYAGQINYIEMGAAPMPAEHKQRLMKLLPKTRLCFYYGLTEASRSTFIEFHSAGDKLEDSVGTPSPNVDVKIVDGQYQELPHGQVGRIMVKGENVMREYYRKKKMTEEVFYSDWLYTGDYGYRDEDGYFYLVAREKEMINVGGLKVSPVEIEWILRKHESIADCACVGIPDPKGITGEAPKAFIVHNDLGSKRPDEYELVDYLRDKLELYKIPIEFEWIDSIPRTSSGKIQRLVLKSSQKQG